MTVSDHQRVTAQKHTRVQEVPGRGPGHDPGTALPCDAKLGTRLRPRSRSHDECIGRQRDCTLYPQGMDLTLAELGRESAEHHPHAGARRGPSKLSGIGLRLLAPRSWQSLDERYTDSSLREHLRNQDAGTSSTRNDHVTHRSSPPRQALIPAHASAFPTPLLGYRAR